ncbi:antibiotic biosynthesis monooxygenase family protein [Cupriavidus consociatus]|uniref:antibiotic biosynthesis monooxygenase family protein n=1 Tax=Cupriavidus consociatus TaxID=2821357 RepID=UPI001AE4B231|nr:MULTISPECIES: antibiotic biosynthesis monooxygenase family protein [unclassified Cupriavidus]MBP0623363.1 antibiotic biosynthesis monooxygenase [Cupriavidus sp. LEh25]MDK2660060.1 antibiotic biosynthesis monooxygenase family protein [Cupriavidus sp. LEh21]
MIKEIAQITIKPGTEQEFEQGVNQAKPLFLRSRGCHGVQLFRSVESSEQYTLVVEWETLEDHMVHFRESSEFQQWRALVGGSLAAPPKVHHVSKVL